jgi:DNA ligase-1
MLLYAYHPFRHFGIRKITTPGLGTMTLKDVAWRPLLDQMILGNLSGNEAKQRVNQCIELLSPEEARVLKAIIAKDLRAGVSAKTINLAIPGFIPEFGAMLAKTFGGVLTRAMFMSVKLDGLRAIYQDGNLHTRNGHIIKGVSHITDALKAHGEFNEYDGELLIPGKHFQVSSGMIRSDGEVADAVYHVFDTRQPGLPFEQRYEALLATTFEGPIKLVKHLLVVDQSKLDKTYAKAIAAGYEGLVLKTPRHQYQAKRSSDWLKLKEVQSVDAPVVGFYEGEGKYEGQLGGLIVDVKGIEVRVGSGLSDQDRVSIWNNKDNYLGMTAEVLYHEVTPRGSLRHPRFKMWRGDK